MDARDAGITEFVAKPISAKALHERIVNVVANPRRFINTASYFGRDRRRGVSATYSDPERRTSMPCAIYCEYARSDAGNWRRC